MILTKAKLMSKYLFITTLIVFFFNMNVFAQQNGTLTGKVTDSSTGEPLPGANIYIEGKTIGAVTDVEGNYRLLNVPSGVAPSFTFVIEPDNASVSEGSS